MYAVAVRGEGAEYWQPGSLHQDTHTDLFTPHLQLKNTRADTEPELDLERGLCVCVFSQKQHSNAPHIYQGQTFVTERDKKHEGTTTATSTATTKGFSG